MLSHLFNSRFTLDDLISSHKIFLSEKEGKLKFLKRALKDLDLNYCSIPLPLSIFNQTSKEHTDASDEEAASSDTEQPKLTKAPTPDYDEKFNFLSKLGEHDEARRKFAEERRKEYNEYLKEAKFATSRVKLLERKTEATRMGSPLRSYAELLDEKRANEKAYRSMNDHHITVETNFEPDFFGYNAKHHRDSGFDILTWRSKYPGSDVVEPLVPKNRLLATHSSRVKACQYKEELMKQIEDKHRREEERLRREKEEELLIEKRLQEQRLRLLKEYEDEQRRHKLKADALARKQEIITEMIKGDSRKTANRSLVNNDERRKTRDKDASFHEKNVHVEDRKPVTVTPTRLPRSPSYLHVRHPKSSNIRKTRASLESRFGAVQEDSAMVNSPSISRTTTYRPNRVTISPFKSRGGGGGDESPPSEPAKYQPPEPIELTIQNNRPGDGENYKNDDYKGYEKFKTPSPRKSSDHEGDRVLARLSQVRRKMQEDHQRMLQHLKERT